MRTKNTTTYSNFQNPPSLKTEEPKKKKKELSKNEMNNHCAVNE